MKKSWYGVIVSLFVTSAALGQNKEQSSEYSFGVEGLMPISNFKKSNNVGFGGSIKYAYNLTANTAISLQVGYFYTTQKDSASNPNPYTVTRVVPVLIGFRYMLPSGFYFEPQAGAINTGYKSDGEKSNQTNFGYGINVGYKLPSNWDVSLNFKGIANNNASLNWVGLKFAYTLTLNN